MMRGRLMATQLGSRSGRLNPAIGSFRALSTTIHDWIRSSIWYEHGFSQQLRRGSRHG